MTETSLEIRLVVKVLPHKTGYTSPVIVANLTKARQTLQINVSSL
ncbi:MAG: hypothetical protein ACTS53_00930 [Candidatus Hodgkinia cicadicola]